MIVNAVLFFNELDLLELRLKELYSVVDVFYVLECVTDFSGTKRNLIFEANKHRFEDWKDKIRYIIVPACDYASLDELSFNTTITGWIRHYYQQDYLKHILPTLCASDAFCLCDADEIPSRNVFLNYRAHMGVIELQSTLSCFYLNYCTDNPVYSTFIVPGKIYNEHDVHRLRPYNPVHYRGNPFKISDRFSSALWHFSHINPVSVMPTSDLCALKSIDPHIGTHSLGYLRDKDENYIFNKSQVYTLPECVQCNTTYWESKKMLI
jgi:hypothetical protein